jgi:hypothetical protein
MVFDRGRRPGRFDLIFELFLVASRKSQNPGDRVTESLGSSAERKLTSSFKTDSARDSRVA